MRRRRDLKKLASATCSLSNGGRYYFGEKSRRHFLDPIFDVESDGELRFGVRARLTAALGIRNLQVAGGSSFLACAPHRLLAP